MGAEKRRFQRKPLEPLELQGIVSLNRLNPISQGGLLVQASASGFLVEVRREDLCDSELRSNLTVSQLQGSAVSLYIPVMDLEISGVIVWTRYRGDGRFQMGLDYSEDAPEYWRECLCDLLPALGENG